MIELFSCQSKRGEQLHYYFEHYLVRCRCGRDACIYIGTPDEVFDGLEQVDECVKVGIRALGCLLHLDVKGYLHRNGRAAHTASRIAMLANITFAGGSGYTKTDSEVGHPIDAF